MTKPYDLRLITELIEDARFALSRDWHTAVNGVLTALYAMSPHHDTFELDMAFYQDVYSDRPTELVAQRILDIFESDGLS